MKFATGIHCPSPACGATYDALVEDGFMAECPGCGQVNRVSGKDMSNTITGMCDCGRALDDHIYGRLGYACPTKGTTK